jgi:hypothetical protein
MTDMTKDQVKEILDRVLTWPPERQQDAAEILISIEAQDKSEYHLSDEQIAELRRRRAEKKGSRASAHFPGRSKDGPIERGRRNPL